MEIAFIKKKFNPYGGGERYLATVIEKLKGQGHGIHVYSTRWEGGGGVTMHRIETLGLTSASSVWSFNRNVEKALRERRLHCVLSFERVTCGDIYRAGEGCHRQWLAIRRSVEGRLKALTFPLNPLHRTLLSLERRIFEDTRHIVANSALVKRHILAHYRVPEERIQVIYNGVDTVRFSPARRAEGSPALPDDAPLVLFVGSGYERKGLGTVLAAMPRVKGNARLVVVGRGETEKFRGMARSLGVEDRVLFLGPRDGIEGVYAASDLFVLPTLYDPFSNATLEAMASGLPVITTRNNGAAELIEAGKEGFILEDMLSGGELAEKINTVLENREAMGRAAREKAEGYPVSEAVAGFVELIERCQG